MFKADGPARMVRYSPTTERPVLTRRTSVPEELPYVIPGPVPVQKPSYNKGVDRH